MKEEQLITQFLEEVEAILYLEQSYNDKNIAEIIIRILEKEYDI
jgi:hypothetical protein